MSIRIMSAVWELELSASEKLVMLALADNANDEGLCWPSITTLAKKCGKGERSVQQALRELEKAKLLTREETKGKGCKYTLHPRNKCTPAINAPPQKTTVTPAESAPKPSVTVIEEEWVERERAILKSDEWKAFKAMRREIKRPVNATAEKRLLAKLKILAEAGYPPGEVLDQSTANCWRGVFEIAEEKDYERYSQPNRGNGQRMGGPRPDPTLALVRAAHAAQRQDGGDPRGAGLALPPG